ncbi:hypothetical protein ACFL4H_00220 [Candidatus Neomarinimicrobiota bacterium]
MSTFSCLVIGEDYKKQIIPFGIHANKDFQRVHKDVKGKRQELFDIWKKDNERWLTEFPERCPKNATEYMTDYEGFEQKDGWWGYYTNLAGKFESFIIGGNFTRMLLLKDELQFPDRVRRLDTSKVEGFQQRFENGYDSACICDIDFVDMEVRNRNDMMDYAHSKWLYINGRYDPKPEEEHYQFFHVDYYKDTFESEEEVLADMAVFGTTALVLNKEWIAPGTIGLFAEGYTTKEAKQFRKTFYDKYIMSQDPKTRITIVQCRI